MSLPGFRISKVSIPIYISNDGSFFYPKLFPVSLLYYCIVYVNLIKDRSFLTPSVLRESGCKGKEFLAYPPNFCGTFFEVFSERSSGVSFPKAGAKVRSLFQTAKRSAKFFSRFFPKAAGGGAVRLGLSCERRDRSRKPSGAHRAKRLCNILSSIAASFPKAGAKVRVISILAKSAQVIF